MNFNDREKIIALTPLWKGERLPDGRPKVEDKYLDALYGMTLEEVWKPIFVLGYEHQFVGGGENPMHTLHNDDRKLVGRAVTCTYCPTRPDLHDVQFARGAEDGLQVFHAAGAVQQTVQQGRQAVQADAAGNALAAALGQGQGEKGAGQFDRAVSAGSGSNPTAQIGIQVIQDTLCLVLAGDIQAAQWGSLPSLFDRAINKIYSKNEK